jgi:hypothetical protein
MKIKSINYQRTYNLGMYESLKLGIEIEVDDDNTDAAFLLAKDLVQKEFKKLNHIPDAQVGSTETIITEAEIPSYKPPKLPKQTPEEKIIEQIMGTTDLLVLQSFKLLSNKYPAVQVAYDNQTLKLNSLKLNS